MSEGEFVDIPPRKAKLAGPADTDETTDTYDTIDWLVKNVTGNNGRVGIWGGSYGGFFAAFGMIDAHPALVAASPQAPIGDVADGDDSFHNGAFYLAANFNFYRFTPRPGGPAPMSRGAVRVSRVPDAYDFFLRIGPLSIPRLCTTRGRIRTGPPTSTTPTTTSSGSPARSCRT